jgi:hypothetical protein
MKVYLKETRSLDGEQYLKGWNEVDPWIASRLVEVFRGVCRFSGRSYGEGWREVRKSIERA